MSEFRKEFVQTLELLARGFERVARAEYPRSILVGAAAVRSYTSGAVDSGDFGIVAPADAALESALLAEGFDTRRGVRLARPMDEDYLDGRIKTETSGAYDLRFLRARAEERKA